MRLSVTHHQPAPSTYRAARVASLFNADDAGFDVTAEFPIEGQDWSIGVIVGPSGSGKTSLGRRLFGAQAMSDVKPWPAGIPLVEAISPDGKDGPRPGTFDAVTGALAAVGLGSVPAWLRPYAVLSNGEKFRAELARVLVEAPAHVVIDEFTSVVDRQIARVGAGAFAKAWKRAARQSGAKAVLLTCHYDVLDWIDPDWVLDTTPNPDGQAAFTARWLCPGHWYARPPITLELRQVQGAEWAALWPMFEPHYYLTLPKMINATYYVGFVDGEPVAHVGFSTRPGLKEARASRLVVMPEWQGAGVGMGFLNAACDLWRRGQNRFDKPMPTLFHTSHPGLSAALRRDHGWTQVSAALHGQNRGRCIEALMRSAARGRFKDPKSAKAGYGGHFRAVQGFRYLGVDALCVL